VIAVPARVRELTKQLSATRDTPYARDIALLAARIALAWLFIYHGAATLFGWFGGGGLHSATVFFATIAHLRPGGFFAAMAGIVELAGAVAVGLGVFGRIGAAGLVGTMAMAMATVTFSNGIASNASNISGVSGYGGGYELNIALAVLALVVAIMGTGRYSLDVVLRTWWGRASAPKGAS
jgi:putative oxidoreductase